MEQDDDKALEVEIVEITQQFRDACNTSLQPGELCSCSWFTLQHAMSAIEIMDPKMDIRSARDHRILSTTELLIDNALPLGDFKDVTILVGIMDKMLCSIVNWLTGDSLAQTLFVCRYMHCTQLIEDPYLAVFCELCRRCVRLLRQAIITLNAFNEEDHYAPVHNIPLIKPDPIYDCFCTVKCDTPLHIMTVPQLLTYSRQLIEDLPDFANSAANDPYQMLKTRLGFIISFLTVANYFQTYLCSVPLTDADEIEMNCADERDSLILPSESPTCAARFWLDLLEMCTMLTTNTKILNNLCDRLLSTLIPTDKLPGFEPYLNYIKLPSHIPRTVEFHDSCSSFSYFRGLTSHLLSVLDLISGVARLQSPNAHKSSLHFLWAIFRANGQTPCSYMPNFTKSSEAKPNTSLQMNSCLLVRTICIFLYKSSTKLLPNALSHQEYSDLALQSWLLVEPEEVHVFAKNHLLKNVDVCTFLQNYLQILVEVSRLSQFYPDLTISKLKSTFLHLQSIVNDSFLDRTI